jgi:hypothetical protein
MSRKQPSDATDCSCGTVLQLPEERRKGRCDTCSRLEKHLPQRDQRHRGRHTPAKRLAESYARLRAHRTGELEHPTKFLSDARQDLDAANTAARPTKQASTARHGNNPMST